MMKNASFAKTNLPKRIGSTAGYVLLLFAASFSACDRAGLWRTLPFLFLLPPCATLFYNRKRRAVLLCGICTLIFCLSFGQTVGDALFLTAAAVGFSSLGMLTKRLAVTAVVNPSARKNFAAAAVGCLTVGIGFYAALFGNPFGGLFARRENVAYLAETYGDDAPTIAETTFDPAARRYYSTIRFSTDDGGRVTAQIASDSYGICDGYRNYHESVLLSERRDALETFLSSRFAAGDYILRIGSIETNSDSAPISASSRVDEFVDEMHFELAFTEAFADENAFAEKCEVYRNALSDGAFAYGAVTFYGGIADRFCYRLTTNSSDTEPLRATDVEPYDAEAFTRYYTEEEYADAWRRGW